MRVIALISGYITRLVGGSSRKLRRRVYVLHVYVVGVRVYVYMYVYVCVSLLLGSTRNSRFVICIISFIHSFFSFPCLLLVTHATF